MGGRRTNLGLLIALAAALATGPLAFATGVLWARVVLVLHGIAGLGLLVLVRPKVLIVRHGLERRRLSAAAPAILLGVLVGITVLSGLLRSAGLVLSYGPLDDMQVHVGAALLAAPLGVWHVIVRPARPRVRDLSRRSLVRTGVVLGAMAGLYVAVEGATRFLRLPGARRRFTGSYEQGSGDPSAMPVTQWFDDRVPSLDPSRWRLEIRRDLGVRSLTYEEVLTGEDVVRATLDCTGGWYAEQEWRGIRLDRIVEATEDASSLLVVSATGYSRRLPARDLPRLLLATHAAGHPLSPGHGFPLRLVAPGRRGFWWVKWVVRIEVSSRPWWLQSPFPLS